MACQNDIYDVIDATMTLLQAAVPTMQAALEGSAGDGVALRARSALTKLEVLTRQLAAVREGGHKRKRKAPSGLLDPIPRKRYVAPPGVPRVSSPRPLLLTWNGAPEAAPLLTWNGTPEAAPLTSTEDWAVDLVQSVVDGVSGLTFGKMGRAVGVKWRDAVDYFFPTSNDKVKACRNKSELKPLSDESAYLCFLLLVYMSKCHIVLGDENCSSVHRLLGSRADEADRVATRFFSQHAHIVADDRRPAKTWTRTGQPWTRASAKNGCTAS